MSSFQLSMQREYMMDIVISFLFVVCSNTLVEIVWGEAMYVCLLFSSKTTLRISILKFSQAIVFIVPMVHDLCSRISSNEIIIYFLKISSA